MDTPAFTFDEDSHTYRLGNEVLPSVTDIVKPLQDYAAIPAKVMEHARQKGEAIHWAVRLHSEDDLDVDTLDPAIVPRFEAWLKFLDETGFKVIGFEQRMYSSLYRYAGTPDFWGEMNGEVWLPDTKPPSMWKWYPVQLSGYQQLLKEQYSINHARRATLQLMDDGRHKFTPYDRKDDARDMSTFLSLLNVLNWRKHNGCYSRSN